MQKNDARITFNIENTIMGDQGSVRSEKIKVFNSVKP